jgi:hypothetical protein
MATPTKTQTPQAKTPTPAPASAARPVAARPVAPAKSKEPRGNQVFLFDRTNYTWMIGGVVLILLGFMLMAGGKSPDPHKFLYDEIYSFRRITLAPIVILLGFTVEVFAIMRKPQEPAA